jgi:hypothetical protein
MEVSRHAAELLFPRGMVRLLTLPLRGPCVTPRAD